MILCKSVYISPPNKISMLQAATKISLIDNAELYYINLMKKN